MMNCIAQTANSEGEPIKDCRSKTCSAELELGTRLGLIDRQTRLVEDAVVENPESSAVLVSDEISPTGVLMTPSGSPVEPS